MWCIKASRVEIYNIYVCYRSYSREALAEFWSPEQCNNKAGRNKKLRDWLRKKTNEKMADLWPDMEEFLRERFGDDVVDYYEDINEDEQ